jgi:hypothetical protein
VKRAPTPDADQFFVLPPGGSAVAEVPEAIAVAQNPQERRLSELAVGKEYVIRLHLMLWPFMDPVEGNLGELKALWNGVGELVEGSVDTEFIPFSTPPVRRFPECEEETRRPLQ